MTDAFMSSLTIWLGALVTLAVFSYAVKDNPVYRFVQQATLGTYMGMAVTIMAWTILKPRWWDPMSTGFQALFTGKEGAVQAWWILALIPGLMWYFQLSKKYFWVSTIVSGWFVGVAAGLAFKTQILLILPQVSATIAPVNPFAGENAANWAALMHGSGEAWGQVFLCFNNLLLIVLLLAALFYFFFSIRTDRPTLAFGVRFGRVAIMVCLGALFGNTVMTRVAYLIERLLFLYNDWIGTQILAYFHG